MFRNYLAAALRNLVRNKLYAAINIVGLAVGFAAALLIGLYVRDEFSYDTWIHGHEQTYLLATAERMPNGSTPRNPVSDSQFAPLLQAEFPAIKKIARLMFRGETETLRRGDVESSEMFYWADPDIFAVLPVPVVAGDLAHALDRPDGIVLTRATARKFFGRDDPIGETIEINRAHPMQVTAVIENFPSRSHLRVDVIASGRASFSALAAADAAGPQPGITNNVVTYLRIDTPAKAREVQEALKDFVARHKSADIATILSLTLVPIAAVHIALPTPMISGMSPSGSLERIYAFSLVAILVAGIAVINFVNLMTARASRRAIEIGVRKVSGAERQDLIVQFMGETFLYVAFALALAIGLTHLLLPAFNGFLGREISSPLVQGPALLAGLLAVGIALTVVAGAYPALILSAFRPMAVLRSTKIAVPGTAGLRAGLVVAQFTVLIGLTLVAGIIARQMVYAARESTRLDSDQVLIITGPLVFINDPQPKICASPFKDAVAALPGVRGAECSSASALALSGTVQPIELRDGTKFPLFRSAVDYGFFSFYGVKPLAGRLFAPERGDMEASQGPETTPVPAVLNESAARKYGFSSPESAVGRIVEADGSYAGSKAQHIEIIGVVPDIPMDVHYEVRPTAYFIAPKRFDLVNVRLAGQQIPETLQAIDRLWKQFGDPIPTPRRFLDDEIEARHRDITEQGQLFVVFAGVAVFIAVIGMFGLATFLAEFRTKEIGIRKAMGASKADILRLLLCQFAKPVLWASLIAWPVAGYLMLRWLEGFAYHVDLGPWIFIGASALALAIAILTVSGQVLLAARSEPAAALRYE